MGAALLTMLVMYHDTEPRILVSYSLLGLGFFSNILVIVANKGHMPVSARPEELSKVTRDQTTPIDDDTRLRLLADWIPIGRLLVSPGDILLGIGVIVYFALR